MTQDALDPREAYQLCWTGIELKHAGHWPLKTGGGHPWVQTIFH